MYKLYIVEALFVCYTYHIRQPIAHGGDEMTENKNGEILKDITINDVAKALKLLEIHIKLKNISNALRFLMFAVVNIKMGAPTTTPKA